MDKRLYRSRDQRMIRGICGGMALCFGIDPSDITLAGADIKGFWVASVVGRAQGQPQ
ncbi:MAG: PspC domain-containing protein [Dehalococcoidia bacterium]